MTANLPPTLTARLDAVPDGLRAHVERVRAIARELAVTHAIDPATADLTAAAHDVARHIPGRMLIEEAERLGIPVNNVERAAPILLHGPVGAGWLREDGAIRDPEVLEGVHWHTTAHPDLAPVGQVVFVADKLDPMKQKAYPFQPSVRAAADPQPARRRPRLPGRRAPDSSGPPRAHPSHERRDPQQPAHRALLLRLIRCSKDGGWECLSC